MLFDSHAHLAPGPESLNTLLATMQRLEIEGAVVVPGAGLPPAQLARQIAAPPPLDVARAIRYNNAGLWAQCEQSGGRLFPFYFANPHDPTDEYRAIGAGFSGLKFGPGVHGVPFRSSKMNAYVKVAVEFGHPVYAHCLDRDGFRVSDFVKLANRFPGTTFILGHGGVGLIDLPAVDLIAPNPRILFEISGTFVAVVQYAVERLGAKRVLFGTEYPLQSPRAEIAKLLDLKISSEDLREVSGGNIRRLLRGGRQ
jgi:predicted TIM-barrel fold metal-dependent hydrolase